jgi:ATP-dependent DNA ligase
VTAIDPVERLISAAEQAGSADYYRIAAGYLDGELCGLRPDGITFFSMVQAASDSGNAAALVFFLFDVLYLDGEDLCTQPLHARKTRLAVSSQNALGARDKRPVFVLPERHHCLVQHAGFSF